METDQRWLTVQSYLNIDVQGKGSNTLCKMNKSTDKLLRASWFVPDQARLHHTQNLFLSYELQGGCL